MYVLVSTCTCSNIKTNPPKSKCAPLSTDFTKRIPLVLYKQGKNFRITKTIFVNLNNTKRHPNKYDILEPITIFDFLINLLKIHFDYCQR